ncbi:MAG: glycosyltransferase family 9 protein [Chitinophagales bacterium]
MQKFLIIQTAFIGDVVLATSLIEKLHYHFPGAEIDFLLRKGNESLLANHPILNQVIIWDKQKNKLRNLWKTIRIIRRRKYDKVINVQRFAATGLITAFSGAEEKIGFDKNPFSFLFTKKVKHIIRGENNVKHEIERNTDLVKHFSDALVVKPRLYPSSIDEAKVMTYKNNEFISISPASVWFTKQYPKEKWVEFINTLSSNYTVYLLGAGSDLDLCDQIRSSANHPTVINLCGQLSFLESAALMKDAVMNYVNDSAPMHFASAVNAPVTAVYCSTLPSFGFGPLSDRSRIVEIQETLLCRPCGLHGRRACPLGHFNCAHKIKVEQLIAALPLDSGSA